ncbi:ABC transporter permease/M1 family aminopeptidase [Larkinella rosea]|uniref:Peptidase M1 membrane alanine aminopeptidase domain-containing protein n=1 Tax=Larkinella rosea TaxID=2025312 RepID=A0A3P1BFR0_9BACT|nr:M1 family aminopeptidase [Larkinella rosea]RRA99910.1 hypothetical protein EHT25_25090 [Larkinella rosea]
MLPLLLRFESRYHSRQLSLRAASLLFFLFGMLCVQGGFGGDAVYTNAPYVISVLVGLLSLFSILVSTLLCANVVLRDTTYRMDALVGTSSVQRFSYFISRFFGLFGAVFSLLVLAVAGLLAGSFLADPVRQGPFHLTHYLWPLLVFGLPNLFFAVSLIFTTALLSRSARAVYVMGVLLYVLYLLGSVLGDSPLMAGSTIRDQPGWLPFLIDPFGLAPLFQETRFWSVGQRNHQLFPVGILFGINRFLWSGISLLVLLIGYRRFSFGEPQPFRSKKVKPEPLAGNPIPYRRFRVTTGSLWHTWTALLSQWKQESKAVFGQFPVWIMLVLWVFLMGMEVKDNVRYGWFGMVTYPDTGIIVEYLRSIRPAMLLIIFWSAELVWRERSAQRQTLIGSASVHPVVFVGAKLGALALLVVLIISLNIGIGLVFQWTLGYFPAEWLVYLSLYYYSGLPLFLFAVLVVLIQTVSSNKYLGMLLSMVVAGVLVFSRRLGLEHYLLRYAVVPELNYSSMNGFGHYASAFDGYMIYWSCCAVLLGLLAAGFWPTRLQLSPWQRVKAVGRQWGKTGRWVFAGFALLWILVGGMIFYQTNVIGTYRSKTAWQDWQIQYEKKYKRLESFDQPVITAVKLQVDILPENRRYRVKGMYRLQNKSAVPINQIWLGVDPDVSTVQLEVAGFQTQMHDPVFNQYRFDLKKPLLPGATLTLRFSEEIVRTGSMPFNSENSVVENGSYIELDKYVPFPGYNARLEVEDETVRRKAGLGKPTIVKPTTDFHRIDLETTVSTAADQQVVTVGTLQKSWIRGNRRYFHYQTSQPVAFQFALSSARYAELKEVYKGVTLRIYYHSGQTANVPVMMQALKDALDYGNRQFGRYPFPQLTLAEIPQYKGSATAYPGVIFSRERLNFRIDVRDPKRVNYAYATAAHEVAHQWWALQLKPVDGPGYQLLTESLAKYSEAMILQKRYGKRQMRPYFLGDKNFYFVFRNESKTELPLVVTENQNFASYQKGGMVLYRIQEAMGEERFSRALRGLLVEHVRLGTRAKPEELIQALQKEATESQNRLIDESLRKVVTNELAIKALRCKPIENNRFALQLEVTNTKTGQRADGKLIKLPPDDNWEIAVFDRPAADWNAATKPVYSQKHHFTKSRTILNLTVDRKPKTVVIDPDGYALDENTDNNVQELKD